MAREDYTLLSFSGGELSPRLYGRQDLPVARNGCRRASNFIIEAQGSARFRSGFQYRHHTRRGAEAFLEVFKYDIDSAYILEFTDRKLRFHTVGGVILENDAKTISAYSAGTFTAEGHGFSVGDEIFVDALSDFFLIDTVSADNFTVTSSLGVVLDTAFTTSEIVVGATCRRIYEIDTPYRAQDDLFTLQVSQNVDVTYIAKKGHFPRILTRISDASWTLTEGTRTSDPFIPSGTLKIVNSITQANPALVTTSAAHGLVTGEGAVFSGSGFGMTELLNGFYTVTVVSSTTFTLDGVDTTAFPVYTSGGRISPSKFLPSAVAFYESRVFFAGIPDSPGKIIASRAPSEQGDPRFNDFTTGVSDDHAVDLTIADDEVNAITWLIGTDRLLFVGTLGTETKVQGETSDRPITPTSVSVRPLSKLGVDPVKPINKENAVLYVQQGQHTLRSLEVEDISEAFTSYDRNILADHIFSEGVRQLAWQSSRPNLLWAVRPDGTLAAMTFNGRERLTAWHTHNTGDGDDAFVSIATLPRRTGFEQLWACVRRRIEGVDIHYLESITDETFFLRPEDFYRQGSDRATDTDAWLGDTRERQRDYIYLDSTLTFSGLRNETLTLALETSGEIRCTVSGDGFFTEDIVGQQMHFKYRQRGDKGRLAIIEFVSATEVLCSIQEEPTHSEYEAGQWFVTASTLKGLAHLEGRTVGVITDGSRHPERVVVDGTITLDYPSAVVHVGLLYTGVLQPMALNFGGTTGPGINAIKNANRATILLRDTIGVDIGTDLYNLDRVSFNAVPLYVGVAVPPFTGVKEIVFGDSWERQKTLYVQQSNPLPCNVQLITLYGESIDE